MNELVKRLRGQPTPLVATKPIASLCADAADEIERLEHGYQFTGSESAPCPGCLYDNGKLIKVCGMHEQIAFWRDRCERLE